MNNVIYINTLPKQHNMPTGSESTDELCSKFINWLDNAIKGDKFCYYFGEFISGRKVGRLAMDAYEMGSVTLYQSRVGYKFEFWAEKLPKEIGY